MYKYTQILPSIQYKCQVCNVRNTQSKVLYLVIMVNCPQVPKICPTQQYRRDRTLWETFYAFMHGICKLDQGMEQNH